MYLSVCACGNVNRCVPFGNVNRCVPCENVATMKEALCKVAMVGSGVNGCALVCF